MLRIVLLRAFLVALPFVLWFAWREIARRTGRPMGAAPWTWLAAAGAALFALSLLAMPFFHEDNRQERYVPAEVTPGGRIAPGHFEPKTP
ncbi:MAG: hypothetical protein ACK4YQ_14635 [Phenylobacterium sp.]|uniref:hypothetical protein n=1 Tax=Phenylobacterium sp. TaxID=1871053 RepID=UPI00391D11ED